MGILEAWALSQVTDCQQDNIDEDEQKRAYRYLKVIKQQLGQTIDITKRRGSDLHSEKSFNKNIFCDDDTDIEMIIPLNDIQQIIVSNAKTNKLTCIRGPPGTGKTHTATVI